MSASYPTPCPPSVSERDRTIWAAEFLVDAPDENAAVDASRQVLATLFPQWQRTPPLEVFICGQWLFRELTQWGCGEALASRLCFALGQKLSAQVDPDPWDITISALSEYRLGRYEEPSKELALQLCDVLFPQLVERFGRPSPDAIERATALSADLSAPISPF